jgi:hypothetical protein
LLYYVKLISNVDMTIFDLIFILAFLAGVATLLYAAVAALRRHRALALRTLGRIGLGVVLYFTVLVTVSLLSPRRLLKVGEQQCWDEWCVGVTEVRRTPVAAGLLYTVNLRVSSRARVHPQRERGVTVYLLDDLGRRFDAEPADATAPGFDVLLRPNDAVDVPRSFQLPADARGVVLVVSHTGWFPGPFIIANSESLFHKRTAVRLD